MENIIRINVGNDHIQRCDTKIIARTGESLINKIEITLGFDVSEYGAYLEFKKPNGEKVTTQRIDIVDSKVVYNIPLYVLDMAGDLELQIVLRKENGAIWKSTTRKYYVDTGINATDDIPDKEDFITEAQKILNDAEKTANEVLEKLGDDAYIEQVFSDYTEIANKSIFINCTFNNSVRISNSCTFIGCTFNKPYESTIKTGTQKVDTISFKDCTFIGNLEDTSEITDKYRISLYANNLTFDNCYFKDIGVFATSMSDINTSDFRGVVTITNCDFYKSPYSIYVANRDENAHIECVFIQGRFMANITNCYFHNENSNLDALDLYMCYSAKVSNCYFSVREGADAMEVKSVYDGLEGGTYGGETNIAGASKMISITDCIFDFNGCTKFTRGIAAWVGVRNDYVYTDDSIIKSKTLYIDNCKGMNGNHFIVVEVSGTNAYISNIHCDDYLNTNYNQTALRITEESNLPYPCKIYATNLNGSVRTEKFTIGECVIANSKIDIISAETNKDISALKFVNCEARKSYFIYNGTMQGTLNFENCKTNSIYAPNCDLKFSNCAVGNVKGAKNVYLDNCTIDDLNFANITEKVTYTTARYKWLNNYDETKVVKDATYKDLT